MSRDEAHFFLQRHNRCGEASSSEVFFQNRFKILGSIWGSSDSIFQALQGVTPIDISINQFYQTLRVPTIIGSQQFLCMHKSQILFTNVQ